MTEAVDLSEFDDLVPSQERGIEVELLRPNGKKLGSSITVAGIDSKRHSDAVEAMQKELEEAEDLSDSTEAWNARKLRVLAKCTISWSPMILDGATLECTEANAVKLYTRHPFIRDQVAAKSASRASFMRRSAKGSAERSDSDTTADAPESQQ